MKLLDYIESQLVANRLPLVAVTVAAVPYANTPVVLSLHWHGFVESGEDESPLGLAYESVPSSSLQLNERWDDLEELDRAALDVAWELGAWDIARVEAPGFMRPGASTQESLECMTAFGTFPYLVDGEQPFVADIPDVDDLLQLAGREGYLKWQFRPVRGGLWAEVADDLTLEAGGYRNPPCPYRARPPQRGKARQTVCRLGRTSEALEIPQSERAKLRTATGR